MIGKRRCLVSSKPGRLGTVVLTILVSFIWGGTAFCGQLPDSDGSVDRPNAMPTPAGVVQVTGNAELDAHMTSIATQLTNLEEAIDSIRQSPLGKFMPLLVGVLGAVLAAIGTYVIQNKRLKHELTLADGRLEHERKVSRDKAIFEAQSELIRARSKRREDLYAPLRTFLAQSKEIYDQMCRQLKKSDDSKKYDWISDPGSTSGQSFVVIDKAGQAEPFRLLYSLPDVYGKDLGVDPLIDEILLIGEQIANTIKKSAGLVMPDQEDLARTLSQYLAHYVVMKEIRDAAKENRSENRYTVGYYPRGLNKQVDEGFCRLTEEINRWEVQIGRASNQLFETMQNEKDA